MRIITEYEVCLRFHLPLYSNFKMRRKHQIVNQGNSSSAIKILKVYLLHVAFIFALSIIIANAMPIEKGSNSVGRDRDSDIQLEDVMPGDDLFEGDLKISLSMIIAYYNLSRLGEEKLIKKLNSKNLTMADIKQKASIISTEFTTWPNNIVRYHFHSNISLERRREIRQAMDHWEEHTCLRFLSRDREDSDYIEFVSFGPSCFSSHIGWRGGKQVVNLLPRCKFGISVHEIGHAIGFWHEQSRPDRDNYITMHYENIRGGTGNPNFFKRSSFEIDYQGSTYDYGSIMHYPTDWGVFPGCKGERCITMSVNNPEEYRRQGSPKLGHLRGLSPEDIKQTNRLYSCPKRGIRGFLSIQVKQGYSLPDTDGLWNEPDPYVVLTALDFAGQQHIKQTSYKSNTRNPVWNELILYGESDWQFFRITVWDDDNGLHDVMSMSQTVPIKSGWHRDVKHCENTNCSGYVMLDYNFDPRIPRNASLRVYVHSARNLRGTDSFWNKPPDAYIRLEAVRSNAVKDTLTSKTVFDSHNPTWNEWIDYGCNRWNSFFIQIEDEDIGPDDRLSDKQWVFAYLGFHTQLRHNAYDKGYLTYDYSLTLDKNECVPNPCQHGASCTDGCSDYTCSCKHGFIGKACQFFAGILNITARYGRNLSVGRARQNDVDPFVEFIAIDVLGYSERRLTRHLQSDQDPDWNEVLNFEYQAWRRLQVRVYDAELGIDQPLSIQENFQLSGKRTQKDIRHNCKNGYVIFDYIYI